MQIDMRDKPLPNYQGRRGLEGHQPKSEEDKVRGYTESVFAKKPYFKCCYCPFDSLEETDLKLHVYKRHYLNPDEFLQQETRPPQATLFDAGGRMIESMPVQAGEILEPVNLQNTDAILQAALEDIYQENKA